PPAADDSPPPGPPVELLLPIAAGPTGVQAWAESASVWPMVKMRKPALMASLPGSPRPVFSSGFWKLSDQLLSVPVAPLPVAELVITSVQLPGALSPANAESGNWGLKVAKNGALPFWIGVPARSSKTVLLKPDCVEPEPTPLNNGTATWPWPVAGS